MSEPTRVLSAQQLLRAVWRRAKAAEHRVGIVEDRVAGMGILEDRVGFLEEALSDRHPPHWYGSWFRNKRGISASKGSQYCGVYGMVAWCSMVALAVSPLSGLLAPTPVGIPAVEVAARCYSVCRRR